MSAAGLLEELAAAGVTLEKAGEKLKFTAPDGVVTPAVLASLRLFKDDLLALLGDDSGRSVTDSATGCYKDGYGNRAGLDRAGISTAPAAACIASSNLADTPGITLPAAPLAGSSQQPNDQVAPPKQYAPAREARSTKAPPAAEYSRSAGPCYTCGGTEFWCSRWVKSICCRCHPQLGTPEIREAYEERAAILEHDAKFPKPEAERLAKEMTDA